MPVSLAPCARGTTAQNLAAQGRRYTARQDKASEPPTLVRKAKSTSHDFSKTDRGGADMVVDWGSWEDPGPSRLHGREVRKFGMFATATASVAVTMGKVEK